MPVVGAVEMGYGHLRAAQALASALGTEVLHVDRPPVVSADELRLWRASRRFYEITSRASQLPVVGAPLRALLDSLTSIPHLHPQRDLSRPTLQVRSLQRLVERGLGRGLAEHMAQADAPLVTTFFAPAIGADFHGCERVYCVVTDVDISRAWVARHPERSRIVYLTPSYRAIHRLRAYGVERARIEFTGFPLPGELLGGPELQILLRNLAARLGRLDRKRVFRDQARGEIQHFLGDVAVDEPSGPPLISYSVGGAGAQAELARPLVAGLRSMIEEGRLRLCLAAGVRAEVAERFREWVADAGLEHRLGNGIEIFLAPDLESYFPRFNALLAETDVLWTKPSEMTFFSALGLPLILSPPVGVHERYNRRWAIENGPGLRQRDPLYAQYWLREWLNEGTLAAAAWYGFVRMPKFGLYQILERVGRDYPSAAARAGAKASQSGRPT